MNKTRVRGVIPQEDGIIMMKRVKEVDGKPKEYYVFPGGGVEGNESIEQAIKREIEEEIGIQIKVIGQKYIDVFNGDINFYLLCEPIEGEIGTGQGPEFTSEDYKDRGIYMPVVMSRQEFEEKNIRPEQIKEKILNEIEQESNFKSLTLKRREERERE